jgi:hypothetical protein
MKSLHDYFKLHQLDITPFHTQRFHFAFQILLLHNPIVFYYFHNRIKPISIWNELFHIHLNNESDIERLTFQILTFDNIHEYQYWWVSVYNIREIIQFEFITYMYNDKIHQFNAMIIYDKSIILSVLRWGDSFLVICIDCLDILQFNNVEDFILYITSLFHNEFYMGNTYVHLNRNYRIKHNK